MKLIILATIFVLIFEGSYSYQILESHLLNIYVGEDLILDGPCNYDGNYIIKSVVRFKNTILQESRGCIKHYIYNAEKSDYGTYAFNHTTVMETYLLAYVVKINDKPNFKEKNAYNLLYFKNEEELANLNCRIDPGNYLTERTIQKLSGEVIMNFTSNSDLKITNISDIYCRAVTEKGYELDFHHFHLRPLDDNYSLKLKQLNHYSDGFKVSWIYNMGFETELKDIRLSCLIGKKFFEEILNLNDGYFRTNKIVYKRPYNCVICPLIKRSFNSCFNFTVKPQSRLDKHEIVSLASNLPNSLNNIFIEFRNPYQLVHLSCTFKITVGAQTLTYGLKPIRGKEERLDFPNVPKSMIYDVSVNCKWKNKTIATALVSFSSIQGFESPILYINEIEDNYIYVTLKYYHSVLKDTECVETKICIGKGYLELKKCYHVHEKLKENILRFTMSDARHDRYFSLISRFVTVRGDTVSKWSNKVHGNFLRKRILAAPVQGIKVVMINGRFLITWIFPSSIFNLKTAYIVKLYTVEREIFKFTYFNVSENKIETPCFPGTLAIKMSYASPVYKCPEDVIYRIYMTRYVNFRLLLTIIIIASAPLIYRLSNYHLANSITIYSNYLRKTPDYYYC